MEAPLSQSNEDYPATFLEFQERFATEESCRRRGKLFYRLVQQAVQVDAVSWREIAHRSEAGNHNR